LGGLVVRGWSQFQIQVGNKSFFALFQVPQTVKKEVRSPRTPPNHMPNIWSTSVIKIHSIRKHSQSIALPRKSGAFISKSVESKGVAFLFTNQVQERC
jgi:hypothetical protein